LIRSNITVKSQFIGQPADIGITKFVRYTGNHAVSNKLLSYR
jgi:hypothetical protein